MKVICVSCFNHYETRMHGIIEYFQSKECDVKYLISDYNHFSKSFYEVDYSCSKQLHVLSYSKNISLQRIVSHFLFSRKVLKVIEKEKPDLIYCMIPPNSLVKNLGKYRMRHENCRLIFDVYDSWPESFPYKKSSAIVKIAFKYWADIRDRYIENADMLVAVSKTGKEDLQEKFKKDIKVLMPTVSIGTLPNYSFDIKEKVSFCYLGHVNYMTDIDLGTEILGGIAKYKKVELHIIGEGQNKEKWTEMLENVGVKVISHGVVFDEEEKKKIFEQCDMGLNIPRPEIKSSMALKSVEYMRFGLPFINSGLGDNEEFVRMFKTGINVKDCDVVKTVLSLKEQDLRGMHNNTEKCYNEKFIKQDYEGIFFSIMKENEY